MKLTGWIAVVVVVSAIMAGIAFDTTWSISIGLFGLILEVAVVFWATSRANRAARAAIDAVARHDSG